MREHSLLSKKHEYTGKRAKTRTFEPVPTGAAEGQGKATSINNKIRRRRDKKKVIPARNFPENSHKNQGGQQKNKKTGTARNRRKIYASIEIRESQKPKQESKYP